MAEEALPNDAALVVKGSLKEWYESLSTSGLWKDDSLTFLGNVKHELDILLKNTVDQFDIADLLCDSNALAAVMPSGAQSLDVLYLIPSRKGFNIAELQKTLTGKQNENKKRSFANVNIYEFPVFGIQRPFTFALSNGIFIGSFNAVLVEDAIRQQGTGKPFGGNKSIQRIFREYAQSSSCIAGINYASLKNLFATALQSDQTGKLKELENWADWSVHKLNFSSKGVDATGVINISDSTKFVSLYNGYSHQSDLWNILSDKTTAVQFVSFDGGEEWAASSQKLYGNSDVAMVFRNAIQKIEQQRQVSVRKWFTDLIDHEMAFVINGQPSISMDNHAMVFLKLKNPKNALSQLDKINSKLSVKNKGNEVEMFRNHEIRYLNCDGLLPALFGGTYSLIRKNYYILQNDYLVMANRPSLLRSYIDDIEDKQLLKNELIQSGEYALTNTGKSFGLWIKPNKLLTFLRTLSNNQNQKWLSANNVLSNYSTFYYTIQPQKGEFAACNFNIRTQQFQNKDTAQLKWTYFADSAIHCGPYLFAQNNDYHILIQDSTQLLSCLDIEGNVKWSLKLDSFIVGKIARTQNDENGMMQFAFCTSNKIYVIKQNGNVNSKFPIKLAAPSTSGIAACEQSDMLLVPASNSIVYGYSISSLPSKRWGLVKWTGSLAKADYSANGMFVALADDDGIRIFNTDGQLKASKKTNEIVPDFFKWMNDSVPSLLLLNSERQMVVLHTDGSYQIMASEFKNITSADRISSSAEKLWLLLQDNKLLLLNDNFQVVKRADMKINGAGTVKIIANDALAYCLVQDDNHLQILNRDLNAATALTIQAQNFECISGNSTTYMIVLSGKDKVKLYTL